MNKGEIAKKLQDGPPRLTDLQRDAVMSDKRRLLIVAGAGSGKTEVMARRIAWWVGVKNVPRENIVAFTFTERAAEEMKIRIRRWMSGIAPDDGDLALGGMYVGTIHGFCMDKLREYWPNEYHNYDILDEGARAALILRGFHGVLGLNKLRQALAAEKDKPEKWQGQYDTVNAFVRAYDLLHDNARFDVCLPDGSAPIILGREEGEWCQKALMETNVGDMESSAAFAEAAARYCAYLRCRRFLDFSASQSELVRCLKGDRERIPPNMHLVVDEMQDVNPVQRELINLLVGDSGQMTAVGDHRQAIYAWRGARVEIIGEFWKQFTDADDSEVVDLRGNFRSTPRIIRLANRWARTILQIGEMKTEDMEHGGSDLRKDHHSSHIARLHFPGSRADESAWIADAIRELVPANSKKGARHDRRSGEGHRGIALSDIAILVRSTTSAQTYMQALADKNIPAVVRAGPDLFSRPEILLFVSALAESAGAGEFIGSLHNPKSLPKRIENVLGIHVSDGNFPTPESVFLAAANAVRREQLEFSDITQRQLFAAAQAIRERIEEKKRLPKSRAFAFRNAELRSFLTSGPDELRRVFPQRIFHMLLGEGEVDAWDSDENHRGRSAMFHLGALSGMITSIETPGWTRADDYVWQIRGLCQYGERQGRVEEQPLMVQPDAVSVCTIHAAKGLEFAAVFLADVNAMRFPSNQARRKESDNIPLDGDITQEISLDNLSDNDNYDGERRLMYVALTRAERFLFISANSARQSKFFKELHDMVKDVGGIANGNPSDVLKELRHSDKEHLRDFNFATSFSDLRYYFECPHDFYLRKVLGFAPTIDQAFGYGRGVHNLMRAIHTEPKKWAELADNRKALENEIRGLIKMGLFYLRYTTGEPAENMQEKGVRIAADYVQRYVDELKRLKFEPEKPFETVVKFSDNSNAGALVSGAIDLVRGDEPPRVSIIDFKSGDAASDKHKRLSEEQMRRQISIYALAAKKELEYQPDVGLVRYLDAEKSERKELKIPLDDKSMKEALRAVSDAVTDIKDRKFNEAPFAEQRCKDCDFLAFCGRKEAKKEKKK